MTDEVTDDDLELLEELGVDTTPTATGGRTPREQRIIAGFEEIERFVAIHGRTPEHGEGRDIFERIYAVRLDRIRASRECVDLLRDMDARGLLADSTAGNADLPEPLEASDEELLADLGVHPTDAGDVTELVHVRPRHEIIPAEEFAKRKPCPEFGPYRELFERVQRELRTGVRQTVKYGDHGGVRAGQLFILEGQKLLVAELGEEFISDYGRPNRRLRVIYDNGTESDLLLRSLQRALYKDQASRRITEPGYGPLFADESEEDDQPTGSIYVLRSCSDHAFIKEHRTAIHKIGVTGGDVRRRIASAKRDPTYLLADVELVAEYKLSNIGIRELESILHRIFEPARLDLELKDRFGGPVEPREWFLVPITAIDEAIRKIKDGSITEFRYDPQVAQLVTV